MPEDLLKFGLIPEFIGRLPVVVTLDELDEEALISILTEPKNALIKQYQKIMSMDGVELVFTKEAVLAVAKEAKERKTGARALRSIIEDATLELMYQLPSLEGAKQCIVDERVIAGEAEATIVYDEAQTKAAAKEESGSEENVLKLTKESKGKGRGKSKASKSV